MTIDDLRAQGYHVREHTRNGVLFYAVHAPDGSDTGAYGESEETAWLELAWVLNSWR